MKTAGNTRHWLLGGAMALGLALGGGSRAGAAAEAPPAAAPVKAPLNLILNPSLETDTAGWSTPFGAWNTGGRDTTRAHDGKASFKATRAAANGDTRMARYVPDELGTGTYTLSVWVYVADADLQHILVGLEPVSAVVGVKSATDTGTAVGRWVQIQTRFTVTTAGKLYFNFYGGENHVGSIYLDELVLTKDPEAAPQKAAG